MRLRWRWLFSGVPPSIPFYIKDLAATASLHLDRFVISFFLGLELTGVCTLFWSIANVVHNLAVYAVVQPQVPTPHLSAFDAPTMPNSIPRSGASCLRRRTWPGYLRSVLHLCADGAAVS